MTISAKRLDEIMGRTGNVAGFLGGYLDREKSKEQAIEATDKASKEMEKGGLLQDFFTVLPKEKRGQAFGEFVKLRKDPNWDMSTWMQGHLNTPTPASPASPVSSPTSPEVPTVSTRQPVDWGEWIKNFGGGFDIPNTSVIPRK